MPEIRTPNQQEMDDVLAVMCEAFQLPFASARKLFYTDPYFKASNKRILIQDGVVASCLSIVPVRMWIGEALVDVAGIANVATLQSHRGKGCATSLLTDTISLLRKRGFGLAALLPYSYDFYRPFGWETAGVQYRLKTFRNLIGSFVEDKFVRPALPSDIPEIAGLYSEHSHGRTGSCDRNEHRWNYLFEHTKNKVVFKSERLEGYAFFDLEESAGQEKRLSILEFVSNTEDAQRGLLSYLAARYPRVEALEYSGTWRDIELSGLARLSGQSNGRGPAIETIPGPMFRIIDFRKAIADLVPNFSGFNDVITLLIHDQMIEANGSSITIEGSGASVLVRDAKPAENPRHRVSGEVGEWSSVLLGHQSLLDAVSGKRLRPFTKASAAVAARLFPRRQLFIPPLDHF